MRHHLTLAATAILAVAVGCGSTGTKQAAADKKAEDTRPAKKQAEQQAQQEKSAESAPADTAPAGSTSTGAAPSYSVVSLDKGQTLSSLARENDVSVDQILAANDHIDDPRKIPVGQPIFIPTTQKAGGEASAQSSGDTGEKSGSAAAQTDGETKTETTASAGGAEPKDVSPSELHKGQQDARFWWPTSGQVTRMFGSTFRDSENPGLGIAAPGGQEVCAVADGTVQISRDTGSSQQGQWEHVVIIRHDNNFVSWYGLLSRTTVEKGQEVEQGDRIGLVSPRGIDGRTQLEFRLYENGQKVDPTEYLP